MAYFLREMWGARGDRLFRLPAGPALGPLVSDFPAGPFPLLLFALFSYVIGDKTILQEVGVKEMKDVETLSPPSETKDQIPTHIVVCFLMAERILKMFPRNSVYCHSKK